MPPAGRAEPEAGGPRSRQPRVAVVAALGERAPGGGEPPGQGPHRKGRGAEGDHHTFLLLTTAAAGGRHGQLVPRRPRQVQQGAERGGDGAGAGGQGGAGGEDVVLEPPGDEVPKPLRPAGGGPEEKQRGVGLRSLVLRVEGLVGEGCCCVCWVARVLAVCGESLISLVWYIHIRTYSPSPRDCACGSERAKGSGRARAADAVAAAAMPSGPSRISPPKRTSAWRRRSAQGQAAVAPVLKVIVVVLELDTRHVVLVCVMGMGAPGSWKTGRLQSASCIRATSALARSRCCPGPGASPTSAASSRSTPCGG